VTFIELKEITNSYCLDRVNLKIPDGELLVLMGPTGSGKTTLLNVIAGLEDYRGTVLFDGLPVDGTAPGRRNIGYLFQDNNLFPHMDVYSNIAFGLKVRGTGSVEIAEKVEELMGMFNLAGLRSRFPGSLSGGERQRVALARALAIAPDVLLLDEPTNSLDYRTSKRLRAEFRMWQKRLGITTVYVTHDYCEAVEMADRMAVMERGKIVRTGRPEEFRFFSEEMEGMP
jgi:ABC-type sugar transport system ATPase subunit